MDTIHVIRHKHLAEGHSIRRIARDLGLHRLTVQKYLAESEPRRIDKLVRSRPVMGLIGPRIEVLLKEWEPRLHGKHRLTAMRLYHQMRQEGYTVSERSVRRYLAERKRRLAEVFIPLIHRPGDEAQVDFFEVIVELGGKKLKVWQFVMRLMYSGRDFVHLYERCDQITFLDAHKRAFEHFGGVPRRVIYDNLKAAVKRLLGLGGRELADRFIALESHYLFEPCFARPGEGHDKGGVESRGKSLRLRYLTPIVSGDDLEVISSEMLEKVDDGWSGRRHADGRLLSELFAEDRMGFLPLPAVAFEPALLRLVSISSSSTVKVQGVLYSLPERWARLNAKAWVGVREVRFCCLGEEVTRPRLPPGGRHVVYRDYLRELSRKPQAVRQVAPELTTELGEPYRRLWHMLEEQHGGHKAARLLAGLLGAINDHGAESVGIALQQALAAGSFEPGGTGRLLEFMSQTPAAALPEEHVPPALRTVTVEAGCAADYDLLAVSGGVS